jgi:hypothetical protein
MARLRRRMTIRALTRTPGFKCWAWAGSESLVSERPEVLSCRARERESEELWVTARRGWPDWPVPAGLLPTE